MILYVLNIKPSLKSVSETKLTRDGIWMEGFSTSEPAYEMCVDIYEDIYGTFTSPDRTVFVREEFYRGILNKYSCDELCQGVEISNLFEVINPMSNSDTWFFEEEVRLISHKIIQEKDYADSNEDFLLRIQKLILDLKNNFNITPKKNEKL